MRAIHQPRTDTSFLPQSCSRDADVYTGRCMTIARPNRVSAPSRRSHRRRRYDACSALVNSLNSALFKSDTAQNDMPLWIQ